MAAAGRLRGKKRKRFPTKQQGMAGQLLFTALVILGSRGAIKAGSRLAIWLSTRI